MIRATVKVTEPITRTAEYEVNFATLPRIGEEIAWRSYEDETHFVGRVVAVKHILYGTLADDLPSAHQGLAELPWGAQRILVEVAA